MSVGWLNSYEEYNDCLKRMIIKVKSTNKSGKKVAVKTVNCMPYKKKKTLTACYRNHLFTYNMRIT